MLIEEFNCATDSQVESLLRPCLDIDRWIYSIIYARPYATWMDLFEEARNAACPLTESELEDALAAHPRIGERMGGKSEEARLSRSEQERLGAYDQEAVEALARGNRAYEEKFDRVFLIRAAGRNVLEILKALDSRLSNSPDEERFVVESQLREIALLRLEGVAHSDKCFADNNPRP